MELGAFIAFIFASCMTKEIFIFLDRKCTGNLHVDSRQKINQYEVFVSSYIISYILTHTHVIYVEYFEVLEFRLNIFNIVY